MSQVVVPLSSSPRRRGHLLHPAAHRHRTSPDLDTIAAGLAATAAEMQLDPVEPLRSYRRVLCTELYDAWIIRWQPGARLGPHDHGGSRGMLHVVEGTLVEHRIAPMNDFDRVRTLSSGDSVSIKPAAVHAVANTAAIDALSVHVYSPPLTSVTRG